MCDYKNPFAEYNSNVMSSEQISEFFTEPFDLFDISDSDIRREKSSIVFIGGRGTGKTMLLRQFSYNVQKVSLSNQMSFLDKIKKDKYIGIYFRVDNPLLRSLDSIAVLDETGFSERIFTHYFELTVFKEYLEIVKIFLSENTTVKGSSDHRDIIKKLTNLFTCPETQTMSNIDELLSFVVDQINYIWKYQSDKAIDIEGNVKFAPTCGMMLQGRLTNEFLRTSIMDYFELTDLSVLLLIDEFENFSETQQRVINTAMRFTKDYGVKFRIGMRPNGFKTFGTLDDNDFVKEGRDYREVEFGFPFVKKGKEMYAELVRRIANKRLDAVPYFSGKSIDDFLGKSENLEEEAKEITNNGTKHIDEYLKLINANRKKPITIDDISELRHQNPLYEMENLRLLLKGETIEYVTKAFLDYLNVEIKSEEKTKYSNDYDNKYKLSFVFILCAIYRVEKKGYYSFTDYCQLSSGIIGCFIELCRRAFDIAYFRERRLLFEGHISNKIQTDAAYKYAQSEREMIQRIATHGGRLKIFVDNIGNAFGYIHKDMYMRYPETNSFPVFLDSLTDENKKLIEIACTWSLLVKKPNTQDTKAKSKKQDIYFLNRVLAPAFKISYRTRGGLNPVSVNNGYFDDTFDPTAVLPKKIKKSKPDDHQSGQTSLQLFSAENIDEADNIFDINEEDD